MQLHVLGSKGYAVPVIAKEWHTGHLDVLDSNTAANTGDKTGAWVKIAQLVTEIKCFFVFLKVHRQKSWQSTLILSAA